MITPIKSNQVKSNQIKSNKKNTHIDARAFEKEKRSKDGDDYWSCMFDKGFQGIQSCFPSVLPFKKPRTRTINEEENKLNQEVAKARVIIENFFWKIKIKIQNNVFEILFGS